MKFSLNMGQYFSNVDLKSIPRAELVRRVGAQLGAVENIIDWAPRFDGAVVVRVLTCADHPNADKLHVCTVDDGGVTADVNRDESGNVQVVCGAPNVHSGMWAVWLPPGATVPASRDSDPLVLEARDIRGIVSNGMLASLNELGIADDHSGILEIDPQEIDFEPQPGDTLTKYFGLDDFVIDCENKMFTHRPDCFGNLGVARELAGINGLAFQSPDWYLKHPEFLDVDDLPLTADNDVPDLVPRFLTVAMKDISVKPSPMWLQAWLGRVGIKPINNVVDVTNFVMHLTGQPLHAFDYDKLAARSDQVGIRPRLGKQGEKITLLGGKEIEVDTRDIVIATDKMAVALAGAMGGADTEVDASTKNIVLEVATFDMYSIRRTSMRHGLFTEAVTRFNKGQSPQQNARVAAFAMEQLKLYAGAEPASKVWDIINDTKVFVGDDGFANEVETTARFINDRLGAELSDRQIIELLENVEFGVDQHGERLKILVPFWRTDIEIPEDVVEEVGRLYGYDKLAVRLPSRPAKAAPRNQLRSFKADIRQSLKAAGANEVLTYSFVHGDLLRKTGTDPEAEAYHLRNALSPDLQYYRTSLVPSLLAKVHANLKSDLVRGDDNEFALFEFGRAHIKRQVDDDGLPTQFERLALVFAADDKTAARKYHGAAFYQAKHYLLTVLKEPVEFVALEAGKWPQTDVYEPLRSALIKLNNELLGVVGEFKPAAKRALKLPDFCAGFELDIAKLAAQTPPPSYRPLGDFPNTTQDVTFAVPAATEFAKLYRLVQYMLQIAAGEKGYGYSTVPRDIFQPDGQAAKRISFRIWLSHPQKTLQTQEVNDLLDKIATEAKAQLGAERI